MDIGSKENKCCFDAVNILEIDGTHVCVKCGLVQDMLSFGENQKYNKKDQSNQFLQEICDRLNIDTNTLQDTERMFKSALNKYPLLRRNILLSSCLYMSCKMNCVPRSMKEVSAVSGVDVKLIGKYESIICDNYFPSKPSDYVNRYGAKLGMNYRTIKNVKKDIRLFQNKITIQNPISICAFHLYKALKERPNALINIQNVTGCPASSIRQIYKKFNK